MDGSASADYRDTVHYYTVEAADPQTGNVSHVTPPRCYRTQEQKQSDLAKDMQNRGGRLVAGTHFENWGQPDDELLTSVSRLIAAGDISSARFSNGSGPVYRYYLAVKKLEVRNAGTGTVIASGYLVMPQSGDWKRWIRLRPLKQI